jgi:hypothetical protein
MPEGKLPGEEKRQAVIVGINEYSDHDIPKLEGAENDAMDICDRLTNYGNFDIPDDHCLIGDKATCKRIREAISGLLWQPHPCDLTLFYFSGHGFVDSYGNGYIAPWDMKKDKPFVCGINMLELRQVMLYSVNKSTILMILDCCYSGIPAKGVKSIPNVKAPCDPCFRNLDKEEGGEGKIILASSEADKVSREITLAHENKEQEPHPHGTFTFYLIEGLDGQASDEYGIITLSKLNEYVAKQLIAKEKQKPKLFMADASLMSAIKIAIAPQTFARKIAEIIEGAKKLDYKKDPWDLIFAVGDIPKVLKIDEKNPEALAIKNEIGQKLSELEKSLGNWWLDNQHDVKREIKRQTVARTPKVFSVLDNLVYDLSFDEIAALDKRKESLFVALCKVSERKTNINQFIKICIHYDNPPSAQKPTTVPSNEKRYDNPPSAQKPTTVPSNERNSATSS